MFSGSGHTQEEDELPFEFKALELALEISTSALDLQVRASHEYIKVRGTGGVEEGALLRLTCRHTELQCPIETISLEWVEGKQLGLERRF